VNCDSLLTIPKAYLESRIGRLSDRKIEEMHKAIRFALDMN
jgi:mRNA-degrading endonuclease toxin of MazEF toxin-antitoxin module